jgi:hypothetical protein
MTLSSIWLGPSSKTMKIIKLLELELNRRNCKARRCRHDGAGSLQGRGNIIWYFILKVPCSPPYAHNRLRWIEDCTVYGCKYWVALNSGLGGVNRFYQTEAAIFSYWSRSVAFKVPSSSILINRGFTRTHVLVSFLKEHLPAPHIWALHPEAELQHCEQTAMSPTDRNPVLNCTVRPNLCLRPDIELLCSSNVDCLFS